LPSRFSPLPLGPRSPESVRNGPPRHPTRRRHHHSLDLPPPAR
jgi:hypothetical protein